MTRADVTPVKAVLGFTNMLLHLIEQAEADEAADYFAVIFDTARVSFRNDIYAGYKAQRPEPPAELIPQFGLRSEEHTSELQSLMRISYAVFCLKTKNT